MQFEKDNAESRKKILYVATTKLTTDGLTAVFIKVARIASRDFHVCFALSEGSTEEQLAVLKSIGEVFFLPSRKKRLPQYMTALCRLIKQQRVDIVHIHGNSATMAFDLLPVKLGGVPVRITHCHNCAVQPWLKQMTLGTLCNHLVTHPVACSIASGKMLYRKPFSLLTNGVDCQRFAFSQDDREKVRRDLELQDAFVLGHIGRFSDQKNHGRLLDIFAAVLKKRENAYLILCGEGENMQRCREKAEAMHISEHVLFLGAVSAPEKYLCAMDVFVLPSLFEGLPLVGIEAQASGLPCVFADTITEETALLPSVRFVSLEASDEVWADTILSMPCVDRTVAAQKIMSAGYDQSILDEQVRRLYGEEGFTAGVGSNYNV